MAQSAPHSLSLSPISAGFESDTEDLGAFLAPVVAGARARGVADTFELLGLAAVLVDAGGRILHIGGRAERLLRPSIRVVDGHLVGDDSHTNALLQIVVESGLDDKAEAREVIFVRPQGEMALAIKAIRFPHEGEQGVQLVKAILVVAERAA